MTARHVDDDDQDVTDAAELPAELVRLVDAACSYVEMYRAELDDKPEGGTSRELMAAVDAWRRRA